MNNPTLYILMRTDMASMNPGKGMAQAAHAANAFVFETGERLTGYDQWAGFEHDTSQGFGTTIVLDAGDEESLKKVISLAQGQEFAANTVTDITYPVRDGRVTHLINTITCGYVFTPCRIAHPVPALASLPLHA